MPDSPGPAAQYKASAFLFTKPRVLGGRFSCEDRFKYLAPLRSLEKTSSGLTGGICGPQATPSPGPSYMPGYSIVHVAGRSSSFPVQRREVGGSQVLERSAAPGPGMYDPSDKLLSTRKVFTNGGSFLADDRRKYFDVLDPQSLTPWVSQSPGPLYNPDDTICIPRAPSVTIRGRDAAFGKSVPSLKTSTPGPGAYDLIQLSVLSSRPRVLTSNFGSKPRAKR